MHPGGGWIGPLAAPLAYKACSRTAFPTRRPDACSPRQALVEGDGERANSEGSCRRSPFAHLPRCAAFPSHGVTSWRDQRALGRGGAIGGGGWGGSPRACVCMRAGLPGALSTRRPDRPSLRPRAERSRREREGKYLAMPSASTRTVADCAFPVSGVHVTLCAPAGSTMPATGVGPRPAPSTVTLHQPPRAATLSLPLPTTAGGAAAGELFSAPFDGGRLALIAGGRRPWGERRRSGGLGDRCALDGGCSCRRRRFRRRRRCASRRRLHRDGSTRGERVASFAGRCDQEKPAHCAHDAQHGDGAAHGEPRTARPLRLLLRKALGSDTRGARRGAHVDAAHRVGVALERDDVGELLALQQRLLLARELVGEEPLHELRERDGADGEPLAADELLDRALHLPRALPALRAVLLQGAHHDDLELSPPGSPSSPATAAGTRARR